MDGNVDLRQFIAVSVGVSVSIFMVKTFKLIVEETSIKTVIFTEAGCKVMARSFLGSQLEYFDEKACAIGEVRMYSEGENYRIETNKNKTVVPKDFVQTWSVIDADAN